MYQDAKLELNLEKVCRTCLNEGDLDSIFTEYDNKTYFDILQEYNIIQDSDEHNFPNKICTNCKTEVTRIHEFYKLCENSEEKLHQYLENTKPNISGNSQLDNDDSASNISTQSFEYVSFVEEDNNLIKIVKDEAKESIKKGEQVKSDIKQMKNKKEHRCEICDHTFYSSYNLKCHVKTHTGTKPYQCDVCEKSYTRLYNLTKHQKIHTIKQKFSCSFCGELYEGRSKFNMHLKVHDTISNKCEICLKEFLNARELLEHLEKHELDGGLECKICGKTISKIRAFIIHIKRHSAKSSIILEDKSYKYSCKYCNSSWQSKQALYNHMSMHKNKNFLCTVCGKCFNVSSKLKRHSHVHTNVRPYKCEHCSKSFTQKSGLVAHTVMHSGLKLFKCTICNKSFGRGEHRKRHMLIHSGVKPFSCLICNKSFTQKQGYDIHIRIHSGNYKYTCTICEKGFYDSSSLNRHKKSHEK